MSQDTPPTTNEYQGARRNAAFLLDVLICPRCCRPLSDRTEWIDVLVISILRTGAGGGYGAVKPVCACWHYGLNTPGAS